MITNVLQKNLSKVSHNKIVADILELVLLFLIGSLAMLIHAKIRIPMQLPGKQGIVFMALIVIARGFSKYKFASSLGCLGAASTLLLFGLGFDDPFMPIEYLALGLGLDICFGLIMKFKSKTLWLIGFAGGISWMIIPFMRIIISHLFAYPFKSMMGGFGFPLLTYFIFGFIGSMIGVGLLYPLRKKEENA